MDFDNRLESGESSEENWPNSLPRNSRVEEDTFAGRKYNLLETFPFLINVGQLQEAENLRKTATDASEIQQDTLTQTSSIPASIVAKSFGADSSQLPEIVQLKLVCPQVNDENPTSMCYYTLIN